MAQALLLHRLDTLLGSAEMIEPVVVGFTASLAGRPRQSLVSLCSWLKQLKLTVRNNELLIDVAAQRAMLLLILVVMEMVRYLGGFLLCIFS